MELSVTSRIALNYFEWPSFSFNCHNITRRKIWTVINWLSINHIYLFQKQTPTGDRTCQDYWLLCHLYSSYSQGSFDLWNINFSECFIPFAIVSVHYISYLWQLIACRLLFLPVRAEHCWTSILVFSSSPLAAIQRATVICTMDAHSPDSPVGRQITINWVWKVFYENGVVCW